MKRIRRLFLAGVFVGVIAVATVSPVLAAKPADRACVGETFSAVVEPGIGQLAATVAMEADFEGDRPGLGQELQILQSGAVPDAIFANTCND